MGTPSFLKRASTNVIEATRQELSQEAAISRRVLERVPGDRLTWKPHPRSLSIGALALHVAAAPGAFAQWIEAETVDLSDSSEKPQPESLAEILRAHEQSVETVRRILGQLTDIQIQGMCALRKNGAIFMMMPNLAILRTLIMNHGIHHRGQLSVYLRLLNIAVPSMYGPSADEAPFAVASRGESC